MIYDTKAILKKELDENREELEREGWELNPACSPLEKHRDNTVVYLRKELNG